MTRPAASPLPLAPDGFDHIQLMQDPDGGGWTRRVLPGEYYVTAAEESITTLLGSCVSACVRDAVAGVGGMNHFMLPEAGGGSDDRWLDPGSGLATRYGSHAMESLINELMKRGARRERLEIKLFGGGRILAAMSPIGRRNIEFIHEYLRLDGLRAVAEDLGGNYPRKVTYSAKTGKVRVKRLRPLQATVITAREKTYLAAIGKCEQGGAVELFE